ncbi:biopolymer transporter ExbD [Sunxiuqinia dokdonensis]|uniref:Biopolymer transporter ExbD n=2 Tax=Sunxiuqinia dokdonensis TaxID=1409788 RepID=A0A0L8V8J0_9BACT|nr:biopolymer transporter ExbD [Sunxiuqinia dokdonensis]
MLLFFFMVSTTMREVTLMVKVTVPAATELSKLEKKSLVSYIYVGTPHNQYQRVFGSEPRIQLNDQFARVSDIQDYITSEREARDEAEVPFMITSLKVDEYTKMGIVTDIKQELRKASALHINYSSRKREDL